MIYNKLIKKINRSVLFLASLALASCYDAGFEEFVPPTGNVNNIQPNTLFNTSIDATNDLGVVFRSFSTDASSYLWDFGDGNTSTEANPNYVYTEGGLYNVKLTTTSAQGLVGIDSSFVAPVFVDFDFSTVDTEVTFDNLTTGAKSLEWDFGNGTIVDWNSEDDGATEEDASFSPINTYLTDDVFEVTLTVTNFLDRQVSVTKSIDGLVLSTIPDFTFDVSSLDVDFTDASTLAVSYLWDFGDGNTSTDASPSNTYPIAGTYDVSLTTTNIAGESRTITKPVPVGGVEASFAVVVQNSDCNTHTSTTGDNADAWDMTPNSTVIDDVLGEVDSPYRAIWNNTDLNAYIDATYCTSEQPGSTSDGNKFGPNAGGGRGVKLSNSCRRLYQVVTVEPGVEYTFTIDTRSEAEGINTEVFILNNEITTEVDILDNADGYVDITNDFNSTKSSSTEDTFTTTTLTFEATSNIAVIYVRAINAVDSSNEVFIDNIDIITPGF